MNRTVKYQGAFSRIVGFAGKRFLFSPPPPPSTFFCFRSNFRVLTRLETLATQARVFSPAAAILETEKTLGTRLVRLYPKLQRQPIGLPKIFIDYFFFQVDQWDCSKPLSIFDRLASSEERFRTNNCTNKLQSQPIGLPKIFIDYLFFQADQSDCTKSVSIFNRIASSS